MLFGPLVPIHERDACRCVPVVPVAAALVPEALPGVPLPEDELPDGAAVEEPAVTGAPVDGAVPLTAGPWVLTVGVDPPTVGVADAGFGTVGVGVSFGTVVEGAGGGFGTVTVGTGGGFGTVTVGVGRGRVEVVTVTVVTPGLARRPRRHAPQKGRWPPTRPGLPQPACLDNANCPELVTAKVR